MILNGYKIALATLIFAISVELHGDVIVKYASTAITSNGISIHASSSNLWDLIDLKDNKSEISHLFDNNIKTYWSFGVKNEYIFAHEMGNEYVTLLIEFKEPVFVTSLSITNGCGNDIMNSKDFNYTKQIYVDRIYIEDQDFLAGTILSLHNDGKEENHQLLDNSPSQWSKIFATRKLVINVIDVDTTVKPSNSCISELMFHHERKPNYKTTYSWDELKKKIDEHKFTFAGEDGKSYWNAPEFINYKSPKTLGDLVFYAYSGNSEAKQLLLTYKPNDIDIRDTVESFLIPAVMSKR